MLDNFQVDSNTNKVVILDVCVCCSSLLTEIEDRTFLFLLDNLQDFETQILIIIIIIILLLKTCNFTYAFMYDQM